MKILFVSLGCDKNLVDTEVMLGALADRGYSFTDDEEEAEIAVVNTCCFIHDAKQESIDAILELAERKTSGQLKALVVTGCLAQRYKDEVLKEIPEVDAVLGTTATDVLGDELDAILGSREDREKLVLEDLSKAPTGNQKRMRTSGDATGYLKIAEGCNKRCTYCVIPDVRGPYRSVPQEDLIKEAQSLAEAGVRELILVAQETTLYGLDLYGEKRLPQLLKALCQVEGIDWIRILYCYPEEITPELIQVIAQEPKILHYLDMPIQHASDEILRKMGRRTNRQELEERIKALREAIPDICLRTTLITGFPGETEEDHEILKKFIKKMKFDRLGVFTYSREEDTPAAKMKPQVPARVKKQRQKELMLLQQEIAFKQAAKMKGRKLQALIEGRIVEDDSIDWETGRERFVYTARTYKDAPNIDGLLFVESERELISGELVDVKITGSEEYDLIGELC